jgi:hypothetical protein
LKDEGEFGLEGVDEFGGVDFVDDGTGEIKTLYFCGHLCGVYEGLEVGD